MADLSKGFNNEERMLTVRTEFLNPTMKKVSEMEPKVEELKNDMAHAFNDIELVEGTKIKMSAPGVSKQIDLAAIIPPPVEAGITLEDKDGVATSDVRVVKFRNAQVLTDASKSEVVYDFDKIVKENQKFINAQIKDEPAHEIRQVVFTGYTDGITLENESLNVNISVPKKEISGQIGTGTEQVVEKVHIVGNTDGTVFDGTTLTINIPAEGGGGGGPVTYTQNFKGIFSSVDDLINQVKDPENNKSFAYVQAVDDGITYDLPYMYINGVWTLLTIKPPLVYHSSAGVTKGVTAIKQNEHITIDGKGVLDLSGFTDAIPPAQDRWYHGYYETIQDLNAAVPTPTLYKSTAFVKAPSPSQMVHLRVYKLMGDGTRDWSIVASAGTIALVSGAGTVASSAPIFGIRKNDMIELDGQGIATIKNIEKATLKVEIVGDSGVTNGDVDAFQFMAGASYVTIDTDKKKAFVNHPQRVIQYNNDFEQDHNHNDYMGNIFYDQTSRCWMGWGIPEAPGGVDHKWTRIAYPKMVDDVRDILGRLPAKAPSVVPGVYDDVPQWAYTSWTYVQQNDTSLPEGFRDRCGGYMITVVQDTPIVGTRPTERLQICYADEDGGATYTRRWNKDAGDTDAGWFPWVRSGLTLKDIADHNTDPDSHKETHKFYSVLTLDTTYAALKANQYILRDRDLLLLADSHGLSGNVEEAITIPYSGAFKFSGRITFDGWVGTARNTQWLLKVIKVQGTTRTIISEFSYNHTTVPVSHLPPIKWATGAIDLKYGDKILFSVQSPTDGVFPANYPDLAFIPMRSYFVIEDATSYSGSRIAETYRRTTGALYSKQNTGVNVHYNSGSSGAIRVYGAAIVNDFKDMTKIKGGVV